MSSIELPTIKNLKYIPDLTRYLVLGPALNHHAVMFAFYDKNKKAIAVSPPISINKAKEMTEIWKVKKIKSFDEPYWCYKL